MPTDTEQKSAVSTTPAAKPDDGPPLTVLLDGDPAAPQQARLGAALVQRGHKVVVLDAPKVAAQMRDEFGATCTEIKSLPRLLGPFRDRDLHKKAKELGVDVVHINYILPHREVWVKRGAPPCVATAWGSDLNQEVFKRSTAHNDAVDRILRNAAAVTADSAPLLDIAKARMLGNKAQAELVLWGVDLASFDRDKALADAANLREQLGILPGERVVLSPRQMAKHYHIDRIVAAFALSKWKDDGVLLIKRHGKIGEEDYLTILKDLAKQHRVPNQLRIAPRMPYQQLPALYALGEIAVSLPLADGVPSTFLELMALRVPIVAWNLAAYKGIVQSGERGGILAGKGSLNDVIEAMNKLHDDPSIGEQLGAKGEQWARSRADWSACVDRWIRIYRKVTSKT